MIVHNSNIRSLSSQHGCTTATTDITSTTSTFRPLQPDVTYPQEKHIPVVAPLHSNAFDAPAVMHVDNRYGATGIPMETTRNLQKPEPMKSLPFQTYNPSHKQSNNQSYQSHNQSYQGNLQNFQGNQSQRGYQQQMDSQGANLQPPPAVNVTTIPVSMSTTAGSGRHVVTRSLEPSFLETLAKEAEQQGSYHMSANSTMVSEYEGIAPLPADVSASTINDDGTMHHNMTVLSMGPLVENTALADIIRTTQASDVFQHGTTHTRPTDMDYSAMSERFRQHDERQQELQKYLKLLLQRSDGGSGSGEEMSEQETPASQDQSLLTPTKSMPLPLQFRGQSHPQGIAFSKTTVMPPTGLPRPDIGDEEETREDPSQSSGMLSLGQVGEISRLLGIYRSRAAADPAAQPGHNPPLEELYAYLHDTQAGSITTRTMSASAPKASQPGTQSAHQGAEHPTREQQQRAAGQKVINIKVPTGSPNSSPTRNKPPPVTARGQPKPTTTRQGAPPAKPKTTGPPCDKKEKPKLSKVWK